MSRTQMIHRGLLCAGVALAVGCSTPDTTQDTGTDTAETDTDTGGETDAVALSPRDRLLRISMALRGTRASAQDMAAVDADPAALSAIVDTYLDDPGFGETLRDVHNEALLVLADYFFFPAGFVAKPPVENADPYFLNRSITESSLRLIEHVVMNNRPYSEIVTADYTLANGPVAGVWGLAYGGNGTEWLETAWEDGRGNAGVLTDSWLYQRHSSTTSNANRGRANAISRALLCYDFLTRDIEIDSDINLADPDVVADAVVQNPTCASCHQILDPLASFFRSYYPIYVPEEVEYPHYVYVPEIFPNLLGVQMRDPAYFGTAADGMEDLGQLIADDPRFSMCATKRFYSYFHQIELEDVPLEEAARLQKDFIDSGLDAKALIKAIVMDESFAVSHTTNEDGGDVVGIKKARPIQLKQLMRDAVGFQWRTDVYGSGLGNVDLMEDSFVGYKVLSGGLDSVFVNRPSHVYSATNSLVLQALAREAAHFRVEADFDAAPADRLVFTLVDETDTVEEDIREQLAALHLRFYGADIAPDSQDVDEIYAVFLAALNHQNNVRRAWKVTLTAMLQDVEIAHY